MNRWQQIAALASLPLAVVGGALIASGLSNDKPVPQGLIAQPVALLATKAGPLGLTGPTVCAVSFTVPGKPWGGVMHWSPAILKPTLIEHVCVTYPAVGTLASVKVTAP